MKPLPTVSETSATKAYSAWTGPASTKQAGFSYGGPPRVPSVAWTPSPEYPWDEDADDEDAVDEYADVLAYDPAMLKNNALASTVMALALLGVMPLLVKTKRFYFRSTMPLCVLVFAAICFCATHLLMDKVPVAVATDVDLDVRMMALVVVVNLVPLAYVPVVWRQSRNISRATGAFLKTKAALSSNTNHARRRRIFTACTCVLMAAGAAAPLIASLLLDQLHAPALDIPVMVYTFLVQTMLWWNMVIQLVQGKVMVRNLLASFQQATSDGTPSFEVIREHRAAWVGVRDLLAYDHDNGNVVYVLNIVYLLAQCTLLAFETLSFYSSGKRAGATALGTFALVYFLELCILCDSAHRAVALMTGPFVATLDRVSLNHLDKETYHEVCFFYNSIIAKPPNCSIRGFASLDRPFLASITTSIVSYLIFLAQFRAEDDEQEAELVVTAKTHAL